jgi:Sec-independent protein translocase protein TatA
MRNISINQLIVIFVLGILLFSDLSRITGSVRNLIKNNKFYKNLKKK